MAIIDNDCLMKSDAIILLEGDGVYRVEKAADLYKGGWSNRIIFSGNITDPDYGSYPLSEVLPFLLQKGVPEEAIVHEDKSLNTREQAIEVIQMAIEKGWNKLILVASHEHQYRAYMTFLREVIDTKSEILLFNSPARNLNWFVDSGWGMRFDRLKSEIDRIERYGAMGHLATADEIIEYQKWKESKLESSSESISLAKKN